VRLLIDGAMAVGVGLFSVLQTRVNAGLAAQVGGVQAAALSFGTGLVLVTVIVLALPTGRRGVGRVLSGIRAHTVPVWLLVGGVGGAIFVAGQGLVAPVVGVALFTVSVVAGLTVNSLLVDRIGLGPGGRRPVTAFRVMGAALAILGVVIAMSAEWGTGDGTNARQAALLLFAVAAGALVAAQQALNGRVALAARSPLTAALINFVVGFTLLAVLASVLTMFDGQPQSAPPAPWEQPWLWLGGPLGVTFVAMTAFAVRGLGVLLFSLLSIVGQLFGSVIVDLLLPVPGLSPITVQTVIAVLVLVLAAAVASIGTRTATGRMRT